MLVISRSSPLGFLLFPLARLLLKPVLLLRNELGRRKSRHDADHKSASRQLGAVDEKWRRKIDTVLSSPDNKKIPRIEGAGTVEDGLVTMHNGIKVSALGYYGGGILNMLAENRGVHEPQEERAFAEIMKRLQPESTMVELGAYWGFYSLWFSKEIPGAQCYLVEPSFACLTSGRENFARNALPATFTQAYVGREAGVARDGTVVVCVDDFAQQHDLQRIHVLHSDIQGAEAAMLRGATHLFNSRKVDYVFISTHSNPLHAECIELLEQYGYQLLASSDLDDSYSGDGLIVAKGPHIAQPDLLEISHRSNDGPKTKRA
jgi:hypothetical protein